MTLPGRPDSLTLVIDAANQPVNTHRIYELVIRQGSLGLTHIPDCEGCLTLGGPGPAPNIYVNIAVSPQ